MPFARAFGGAERLLRTLARHAAANDLELVVSFQEEGPLAAELTALGARTGTIALRRFRDLPSGARGGRDLARGIRRERPALVLSWLPRVHPYLAAATALARPRTPLAWWQHHNGEGEE